MARELLPDALWAEIEPLLPPQPPKPNGGRPRLPDRAALTGILFVLYSGIPWEMLPQEMGCGSGMTCWRRLRDWHRAGVWQQLHRLMLDKLGIARQIDWSRASADAATVPAKKGAPRPARTRRIGASQARKIPFWWIERGIRWRSSRRRRTSPKAPS
jgi:transposase